MRLRDFLVPKAQYDELLKKVEELQKITDELEAISLSQNKLIVRLKEEVKQQNALIGLYEACITKGVKIDFPDVTGQEKGGLTDSTGLDFDDF